MKSYRPLLAILPSFVVFLCCLLLASCKPDRPAKPTPPPLPTNAVANLRKALPPGKRPRMRVTMFKLSNNTANVTLAWDPSPDPTVNGYRVYHGIASTTYTNITEAGNATSVTVSNLSIGTTYYFAATAVATNFLESDYSTEISYKVPSPTQTATIGSTLLFTTDINTPTTNWQVYTNFAPVTVAIPPGKQFFFQSVLSITNN